MKKRPDLHLALTLGVAPVLAAAASAQTFVLDATVDTVDANPGDGVAADSAGRVTLRAAVQEANALGTPCTIVLRAGRTYTLTRTGADEDAASTGDLDVTGKITIRDESVIDAAGIDRIFDVQPGGRLVIGDVTLRGGSVTGASGGGVRSRGTTVMHRARVEDCTALGAGGSGGAYFNDGGNMQLIDVWMEGGRAERAGGAIEANGGTTLVASCTVVDNETGPMPGNGGGLHLTGAGSVTITDTTFLRNTAASEGGAAWNSSSGTMTVSDCTVRDNVAQGTAADNGGGGLFNDGGFLLVNSSTFISNSATAGAGSGGGMLNDGGDVIVEYSEFTANGSNRAGGGVEVVGGNTEIAFTRVRQNGTGASPGNGGGVHVTGAGRVFVDRSQFMANTASAEGGGLWNSASGDMHVRRSIVDGNIASGDAADQGGGGLFNDGGDVELVGSTVFDNHAIGASGSGGGVLNDGGSVLVTFTRFEGNGSNRAGGAVEAVEGETRLVNVTLTGNQTGAAPGNGGGLHLTGAGDVTIANSTITANSAANEGGGLWNSSTGFMSVTGSTIQGNTAPIGPDLFNDGGTFTVDGNPVP